MDGFGKLWMDLEKLWMDLENAIFRSNAVFSLYSKIRAKKLIAAKLIAAKKHTAKLIAFQLYFLFWA